MRTQTCCAKQRRKCYKVALWIMHQSCTSFLYSLDNFPYFVKVEKMRSGTHHVTFSREMASDPVNAMGRGCIWVLKSMAATKCREIDLEQNVAARFSEVDQMSMPRCIYFEKSACFHHKKPLIWRMGMCTWCVPERIFSTLKNVFHFETVSYYYI